MDNHSLETPNGQSDSELGNNLNRRQLLIGGLVFGGSLILGACARRINSEVNVLDSTPTPSTMDSTTTSSTSTTTTTTTTTVPQTSTLSETTVPETTTTTTSTTTTTIPKGFVAPDIALGGRVGDVEVSGRIFANVFQADDPWQPENPDGDPVLSYIDNGPGLWGGVRLANPGETDVDYPHAVLFGHRVTRLKDPNAKKITNMPQRGSFEHIDLVKYGDELVFRYLSESDEEIARFIYRCIEEIKQVKPSGEEAEALIFPEISTPTLTAFACTPKGSEEFRIARRFELIK